MIILMLTIYAGVNFMLPNIAPAPVILDFLELKLSYLTYCFTYFYGLVGFFENPIFNVFTVYLASKCLWIFINYMLLV